MRNSSRRGLAIVAAVASLGPCTLAGATQASQASAPDRGAVQSVRLIPILGDLLGLLNNVLNMSVEALRASISNLSSDDVGDLLLAANTQQLTHILDSATDADLTRGLDTLSAGETGDLLAPVTGGDLTTLLGSGLSIGVIEDALDTLSATELTSVVDGLSAGQAGDLLGLADAAQLTRLIGALTGGQLTSALGTLNPTELGDLLAPVTGGDLAALLGSGLSIGVIQSALDTLTAGELTSVVDGLTGGQISDLVGLASTAQLSGLVGALTAGQLSGILGDLSPAELTSVVGLLTPAQVTGLVGAGDAGAIIDGLLSTATGLVGGTPGAGQVSTLLAQVKALLSGVLPTDPGQLTDLASLLTTLRPLLGTAGLNTSLLTELLTTVNGVLAGSPAGPLTAPAQAIITTLTTILTPATTTGETTTGGTAGTTPGVTTPGVALPGTGRRPAVPKAGVGNSQFTAYRASLSKVKVAKNRRSAKVKLSCPATAPKGCLIKLTAKVSGQKAARTLTLALVRSTSTTVTVQLGSAVTKRLKKKGGSLKLTASTVLSSLPAQSVSAKVARNKTKPKPA